MNLLLNVNSKRELREGDVVRTKSRKLGTVIGFSLFEDEPLLVREGDQVRQYDANAVEFVHEGPGLEPLPPITLLLQEGGIEENYRTCAGSICLRLTETHTTLTLIPKDNSNLRDSIRSDLPFCEAVEELLKNCYVSRLPHLVEQDSLIDELLEGSVEEAFEKLEQ